MSDREKLILKGCPWCGRRPSFDHTHVDGVRFSCLECEERTFEDFEEAAVAWNTRASEALQGIDVRVKELEGALAEASATIGRNMVEYNDALAARDEDDAKLVAALQSAEALALRRGKALEPFAREWNTTWGADDPKDWPPGLDTAPAAGGPCGMMLTLEHFREASRALHLPEVEG